MDTLYIKDLALTTVIGVYAWERRIHQTILVSLEFSVDIKQAASNDDINQALDYATLAEQLQLFASNNSYQLIETLAENMAQLLLSQFPIKHLRLQLSKPGAIANAKEVGIIIERHN